MCEVVGAGCSVLQRRTRLSGIKIVEAFDHEQGSSSRVIFPDRCPAVRHPDLLTTADSSTTALRSIDADAFPTIAGCRTVPV